MSNRCPLPSKWPRRLKSRSRGLALGCRPMSLRLGTGVLGNWDWLVVAGYGALLVIVGVSTSRRHPRAEDYFLASRASHWGAIGLALLASNISSTALIGLAHLQHRVGKSFQCQ